MPQFFDAMLSVLRRFGGDTVVGLVGIAVAMLSIGLAIVALNDDNDPAPLSRTPRL